MIDNAPPSIDDGLRMMIPTVDHSSENYAPFSDNPTDGGSGLQRRGSHDSTDILQVPIYQDDPYGKPDAGAYDDYSFEDPMKSQAKGYRYRLRRPISWKLLGSLCLLAITGLAFVVTPWVMKLGGDSDSSSSESLNSGLRGNPVEAVPEPEPKPVQVQASGSCEDDQEFVHKGYHCNHFVGQLTDSNQIASACGQKTDQLGPSGETLKVSDFCRLSCDASCREQAVTVLEPKSEPESDCEDDQEFVHKGYHCNHFVGQLTDSNLIASACGQKTDQLGPDGETLRVGDFCRLSCDASCSEPSVTDTKPEPVSEPKSESGKCADDAEFIHKGYGCNHFVGQLTDSNQIASACGQKTDQLSPSGETLKVSDFCRLSCDASCSEQTVTVVEHEPEFDMCEDDQDFVLYGFGCNEFVAGVVQPSVLAGRCAQETDMVGSDGEKLLVKNFCRESCGNCASAEKAPAEVSAPETETSVPEPASEPVQLSKPAESPEIKTQVCKDDTSFSHNGYKCDSFVANIEQPNLLASRCSQETKWHGLIGETLLVSHFCKSSCNACNGDVKAPTEPGDQDSSALSEPVQPAETSEAKTEESCEDDAQFTHRGYHCHHYVGQLTDSRLIASSCSRETEFLGPTGETLKVENFCRLSCDACSIPLVTVAEPMSESVQPETPAETLESCEDDVEFVHKGYGCNHFVGQLTDSNLIASACNQETVQHGPAGETLKVSNFCRLSCNSCSVPPVTAGKPMPESTMPAETADLKFEECHDDQEFVHKGYPCDHFVGQLTDSNQIASACGQGTEFLGSTGETLRVSDFCRLSCDTCSVPPVTSSELTKIEECHDDTEFVHKGYGCNHFVGQLTDSNQIASACGQETEWHGPAGETLLVSHFCRLSCDACGDNKREEN